MKNNKIVGLTCTNGRFSYLERLVTCFLNQTVENKELVVFNNSSISINMNEHENISIINNHVDYLTKKPYKHLGNIYRDAFSHIPQDANFVSIMDDDDIYLPNHFKDAMVVLKNNTEYIVWKPGRYFKKKSLIDIELFKSDNNLEGSCVIDYHYLQAMGFKENESLEVHFSWYKSSLKEKRLYLDHYQKCPSYCYDLSQQNLVHISSLADYYEAGKEKIPIYEQKKKTSNHGVGKKLTPWSANKFNEFIDLYFDVNNYI